MIFWDEYDYLNVFEGRLLCIFYIKIAVFYGGVLHSLEEKKSTVFLN